MGSRATRADRWVSDDYARVIVSGSLPLTMYARGEDNFCPRYVETGAGADLGDCGMLDRSRIAKQNVKVVLCESPVVIGDWMANKQITQMELVRRQGASHPFAVHEAVFARDQ